MPAIYDWFSRHRFAVDVILMSVLWLAVSPFSLLIAGDTNLGIMHRASGFVFTTALVVPLAWRRTRTVMAGSIIAAVAILQWALAIQPMPADMAVPLIVYALAAFGPRWASLGGLALAAPQRLVTDCADKPSRTVPTALKLRPSRNASWPPATNAPTLPGRCTT